MNEYKIKLVSPAEHSPAPPTITNDKFAVSKNVISNQHSNTFSAEEIDLKLVSLGLQEQRTNSKSKLSLINCKLELFPKM